MNNEQQIKDNPSQLNVSVETINDLTEEDLQLVAGGNNGNNTLNTSKISKTTLEEIKRTVEHDNARVQARSKAIKQHKMFIGF